MYDKNVHTIKTLAKSDYERARRKALWRRARSFLSHKCNDLLPSGHVLDALHGRKTRDLGLQEVPIERIVGSSGRYRDFDLAFLPLREEQDGRWQRIAMANRQGIKLPPPLLYQVGGVYFVEDGNHRVSVAGASGRDTIKARVIAIDATDLHIDQSCTRLGFKIEDSTEQSVSASCHV
jgi:hypothetical protein